jgi:cytoskeletal protein CcmA (bactofilin family)
MMAKRDDIDTGRSGNLNTILGKGSSFEGTLKVEQSLRIDGKVKGHVSTTDSLVIGKEGEIEGEIIAKNAVIGGKVRAKINATGKVVLESSAFFIGELKTVRLVIDDGAVFEGRCSMQKDSKLSFESSLKSAPAFDNEGDKHEKAKTFGAKTEKTI